MPELDVENVIVFASQQCLKVEKYFGLKAFSGLPGSPQPRGVSASMDLVWKQPCTSLPCEIMAKMFSGGEGGLPKLLRAQGGLHEGSFTLNVGEQSVSGLISLGWSVALTAASNRILPSSLCVRACSLARACVCACMRTCVCVCVRACVYTRVHIGPPLYKFHSAADCCRSSGGEISSLDQAQTPADCEAACNAKPKCKYFSHSNKFKTCVLCSKCDFTKGGSARHYTSWRKLSEAAGACIRA